MPTTNLTNESPTTDAAIWQARWDRQQQAYLPDREERFTALLDVVDAVTAEQGRPARLLDLAGGTGSITLRALRRMPDVEAVVLDNDRSLLALADASLGDQARIVTADLSSPAWLETLPHHGFDAVLTATALHWIPSTRLATLYAEIRTVLRDSGVFANADHMADDGLPSLSTKLDALADRRRENRYAAGEVESWASWWNEFREDPTFGPLVDREHHDGHSHNESVEEPVSWHLNALRTAGFTEVGLVWRGQTDAAFAAVR